MSKFRIAILGIGGVGGFIGGKLASHYKDSDIEVIFIARGENEEAIKENGLKLITPAKEEIIFPSLVTSEPETIGEVNLIICCVKGYSLAESMERMKPCMTRRTMILPLLNGVDAPERIRKIIPEATVIDGCIYIISKLIKPGVVKESGIQHRIFSGYQSKEFAERVVRILKAADINISSRKDIENVVWEKFIFISPMATLTSYLNLPIGGILENVEHTKLMMELLQEVKYIAEAKKIIYEEDIIAKSFEKMKALPYESTTSMHNDFKKGGKTELDSLTGYVSQLGKEFNVPTPIYDKLLEELRTRNS